VTFAGTPLPRATVTGMPLRREIALLDRPALRAEALRHFGLDPQWPTLVVTGGSLGAQRINEAFRGAASTLRRSGIQVLHLTGAGKEFELEPMTAGAPYVIVPYADRMELAYAAADLVIARAGANTVCELTAVGLPGVYVPLPIGNGEQERNVANVLAAGGGVVVRDADLTSTWVESTLTPRMRDASSLRAMAAAAASVGERGGDELLANLVVDAALDPRRR
jgi:UDP-N-acetylglucosamine--N-acetylmuramyl-(pentapeptide) pyrophosphoryl-undecaprenol N-acetylglucosamine transferase